MNTHLQHTVELNLKLARAQVEGLSDEQMVAQPKPGVTLNHPTWVLGHLCVSNSTALQLLGHEAVTPAPWDALFGMGSKPQPEAGVYPSKQELLDALASSSQAAMKHLLAASDDVLQQPSPEAMRAFFPTVGDFVVYDLTAHIGYHLGQLSAWRRAMGLPALF